MSWAVRRATPADEPALASLCAAAVGPDDYVIEHLAWELQTNTVHVALDADERIIGMTVYRACLDGSGWLAMARTHPAFRRQGVNRALVESFAQRASASGVPFLRLWTNAANVDGTATFGAVGFREVARFDRVEAPAEGGSTERASHPLAADLPRVIQDSPLIAKGNGYVPHGSAFMPATPALLARIVARKEFRTWKGNVLALPEPEGPERDILQVTLWAGRPLELLREARRQADAAGRSRVGTYLPHDPEFLQTAGEVGFEPVPWGIEAILCELAVPEAPTGSARAGRSRS